MTVNKITNPPSQKAVIDKINEVIDNLGGGGSVDIDNKSITTNSSDELQTVAVIDDRSGNAIKTWTGTRQQYDAIVTKDSNTLYNIIDDANTTLTLLELLYPVGSIYIGTMATCPLATLGIGTWQLVATDRVLQGAGNRGSVGSTVNESLPNIKGTMQTAPGRSGYFGTGALSGYSTSNATNVYAGGSEYTGTQYGMQINANSYSSTYQDNAPVQQNAYLVNIWERIA